MTIYTGEITIPTIELESSSILGEWMIERCAMEQEIIYAHGFIIKPQTLLDHYCTLFNTFINFEYNEDYSMLSLLNNDLTILMNILYEYIEYNYTICFISVFIE